MTTNEYMRGVKTLGWPAFRGRLWQRSYYEHIIRHEKSLNRIRQYILDNPAHWDADRENPVVGIPERDDSSDRAVNHISTTGISAFHSIGGHRAPVALVFGAAPFHPPAVIWHPQSRARCRFLKLPGWLRPSWRSAARR
jgi:hypothetical protein